MEYAIPWIGYGMEAPQTADPLFDDTCFLNTILMTLAIYFEFSGRVFALCYLLYAVASGVSVIFSMAEQEVNTPETMTQTTDFINMINYLAGAVFSLLVGMLLDAFGGREVRGAVVYPKEAYLTLFMLLLLLQHPFLYRFVPDSGDTRKISSPCP